jgi:hypothetical protein
MDQSVRHRHIFSESSVKAGDLVKYDGSIGIVLGPCTKRWAEPADVWVLWPHKDKPVIESGDFMELVNASR